MTKRDYIAIAERLNAVVPTVETSADISLYGCGKRDGFNLAVAAVADVMATDNPRFDFQLFIDTVNGNA